MLEVDPVEPAAPGAPARASEMAGEESGRAWTVLWKPDDSVEREWPNKEGEWYAYGVNSRGYPRPNALRIASGDYLIAVRPKRSAAADGGRIFGVGLVGEVKVESDGNVAPRSQSIGRLSRCATSTNSGSRFAINLNWILKAPGVE